MSLNQNKSNVLTNLMIYDAKSNSFIINEHPFKINEGKVIYACLVGNNIIFSIKGQKLYKLKTNEKKCVKIFEGDDSSNEEYSQIQTDYCDLNTFYACLNSKIFEFKIENNKAIIQSQFDMLHQIYSFVISSNYIAIQEVVYNNKEEEDEEEEEEEEALSRITVISRNHKKTLYSIQVSDFNSIFIDNEFLYIYDQNEQAVNLFTLDFTSSKPYQVINSVVNVIQGDRIGIQTSENKVLISGCKAKIIDQDNLPLLCYIYKNHFYKVGPNFDSPIKSSIIRRKEISLKLDENIYFDNTNTFYFKRSVKGEILCSKNVSNIDIADRKNNNCLYSQLMLQQNYFIVSAKIGTNKIILYKTSPENPDIKEKVLQNLESPIISLISDLQDSFSFFGLTHDGILNHYKINTSDLKLESEIIFEGVSDFCASYYYIVFLTNYNSIHIINRSNPNDYTGLSKESIEEGKSRILKIANDDEFLYIFYKGENKFFCCQYKIDSINKDPIILDDIHHFWRASNNGSICIQRKQSGLISCGKYTYSYGKVARFVAFSKGSFCIWKDEKNPPEIFTLYSNSLPTSFYNGSCCFFYSPNHETFALRYNDDQSFFSGKFKDDSNTMNQSRCIRGTINDCLSATVIGFNTIVLSTINGISLFFVSLNDQHCYSINVDTSLKSLTNLMPNPNDMNSFFGLNKNDLYLLSYDAPNIQIKEKHIMKDVSSYSVSRIYILIQFKDDSDAISKQSKDSDQNESNDIFIYNLEKVISSDISSFDINDYVYSYCVDKDFKRVDKNLINYSIDDDFVYVFKHQNVYKYHDDNSGKNSVCKLYKLDENKKQLKKPKSVYENVLNVFDSFQVIVVLSDSRFVFKNKIYKYQSDMDNEEGLTLFAACQNEVMVWQTFVDIFGFNFNDPVIYKQPAALKPIINCWFDGENALLFKRGESGFLINDDLVNINDMSFLLARFILQLNNDQFLIISNDQFIIFKNENNKEVKDVGMLASADSYRSDPSNLNRFFAHFVQSKQLYIIQNDRDFHYRCYYNDVVKYDISRKYFVFIDSKSEVHLLKREGEIPCNFENKNNIDNFFKDAFHGDTKDLIPFIDDFYVYFLDPKQKLIRRFTISENISELAPIKNVANVWSTDGVVIQTYEDEQFYVYIKDYQFENNNNQRILSAAIHENNLCVWFNDEDDIEYIDDDDDDIEDKKVESFYSKIQYRIADLSNIIYNPHFKKEMKKRIKNFQKRLNNIIQPIQDNLNEKKKNLEESYEKVEQKLDKVVKMLQTQKENKYNVEELNEMDDEAFVEFVKQKGFRKKVINFGKTPSMFILVLIRRSYRYLVENNEKFMQEIDFWIKIIYKALSILPLDDITLAASEPFLSGLNEKITDLTDFVDSSDLDDGIKKNLDKQLTHIEIILSSFSKNQI